MKPHIKSTHLDEKTAVEHANIFPDLAGLLSLAGSVESLRSAVWSFAARITGCKKRLVMRYAAYDRPAFIINHALSKEVATMYLAGLYRIDPLYEISRTNREPLVVHLRSMPTDHAVPDEQYLAALFKSAFIFAELAVLLPTYGGVTIAICCERGHRRFTESEADILEAIQPLLNSIHKLHIDRVFSAAGKRAAERDGLEGAMLVLDSRNKPIYANAAWEACPHVAGRLPDIVARLEEGVSSHVLLGEGHIAHWERLPNDSSLAPNGSLLMLDRTRSLQGRSATPRGGRWRVSARPTR